MDAHIQETLGLNVSVLKPGTRLLVETRNSFYEMEVVRGKEVTLSGGTRVDGTTRYPKPVKVIFSGCTYGGTAIRVDWLGIDMHMEFYVGKGRILTTSGVKRINIEAPDGAWSYSLSN